MTAVLKIRPSHLRLVEVRTVGRGSFGEALLVKHRSSGQLSVLKRVRLEAGSTLSTFQSFDYK